jgi:PEP-CTERM motif
MRKSSFKFAVIAGALLAGTSPVAAAQIVYTVTGTGGAIIGNAFYSGAFTMVGIGENGPDLNPSPTITAFAMDSTTVTFGSTTVSATNPVAFFTNTTGTVGGFVQVLPGPVIQNILGFQNPIFATYDPSTAIGPIPVFNGGFQSPFQTSGGVLVWQGLNNLTFTAELAAVSGAVPEPATWGLMIAGFGIAGAALRRKPKVSVSFG